MVQVDLISKICVGVVLAEVLEHLLPGHLSSLDVLLPLLIIRDELPLELSTVDVILSLLVKINHQVPCVFQDSLPNVIDCLSDIKLRDRIDDLWLGIVLDGKFDGLTCLVNLLHLYFPVLHNSYMVCQCFSFDHCRRLSLSWCDGFSILPSSRIFR